MSTIFVIIFAPIGVCALSVGMAVKQSLHYFFDYFSSLFLFIRIPMKNKFWGPPTPWNNPILGGKNGKQTVLGSQNIEYDFLSVGRDVRR